MQRADLTVGSGKDLFLTARIRVTPMGLLSIAALVASVLLSTAVLVRTAADRAAKI